MRDTGKVVAFIPVLFFWWSLCVDNAELFILDVRAYVCFKVVFD